MFGNIINYHFDFAVVFGPKNFEKLPRLYCNRLDSPHVLTERAEATYY